MKSSLYKAWLLQFYFFWLGFGTVPLQAKLDGTSTTVPHSHVFKTSCSAGCVKVRATFKLFMVSLLSLLQHLGHSDCMINWIANACAPRKCTVDLLTPAFAPGQETLSAVCAWVLTSVHVCVCASVCAVVTGEALSQEQWHAGHSHNQQAQLAHRVVPPTFSLASYLN